MEEGRRVCRTNCEQSNVFLCFSVFFSLFPSAYFRNKEQKEDKRGEKRREREREPQACLLSPKRSAAVVFFFLSLFSLLSSPSLSLSFSFQTHNA